MSKLLNTLIIIICTVIFVAFFGCSMVMDAATPCPVDPVTAEYSNEPLKGVEWLPFTSLLDAKRINTKMNFVHDSIQIDLIRQMEDDNRLYTSLKDTHASNIQAGLQTQEILFSPTGLGALIPGLSGLGLGMYAVSKPSDRKKIKQLEKKVNGNG